MSTPAFRVKESDGSIVLSCESAADVYAVFHDVSHKLGALSTRLGLAAGDLSLGSVKNATDIPIHAGRQLSQLEVASSLLAEHFSIVD